MGFSWPEYCSGLPFPSPGDLPDPGTKLMSPSTAGGSSATEPPGSPYTSDAVPCHSKSSHGDSSISPAWPVSTGKPRVHPDTESSGRRDPASASHSPGLALLHLHLALKDSGYRLIGNRQLQLNTRKSARPSANCILPAKLHRCTRALAAIKGGGGAGRALGVGGGALIDRLCATYKLLRLSKISCFVC